LDQVSLVSFVFDGGSTGPTRFEALLEEEDVKCRDDLLLLPQLPQLLPHQESPMDADEPMEKDCCILNQDFFM
jgi:hypothetical protein